MMRCSFNKLIPLAIFKKSLSGNVNQSLEPSFKSTVAGFGVCGGMVMGLGLSFIIDEIKKGGGQDVKDCSFWMYHGSSCIAEPFRQAAINQMKLPGCKATFFYTIPRLDRHALFYLGETGLCKGIEAMVGGGFTRVFPKMSQVNRQFGATVFSIGMVTPIAVSLDVNISKPGLLDSIGLKNFLRVSYHVSVISASLGRNILFTGFTVCSGSILSVLMPNYQADKRVQMGAAFVCSALSTIPHAMFVQNVDRISENQSPVGLNVGVSRMAMVYRGLYGATLLGGAIICSELVKLTSKMTIGQVK